jgi:drug/metabolite transporter (DMT)-like permease
MTPNANENSRTREQIAAPETLDTKRALTAEGTNRDAFTRKDWILLAVPGFIWGASFLQIAESLEGFTPAAVTFGRMLFGFLTLAFVPSARKTKIPRSAWPQLFAVAVTWLAFPMTLFPIAQQHISSSLAGMLNGGIPIFAAIVATVLLRRLPGINQRYALVGGIIGLAMIGLPSINEGKSSAFGVLLVIIAIASYGIAVNLSVPLTQSYGAIPVFWRCQLVAVVLTAPLGIPGMLRSTYGARPLFFLISLGVLGTAVAFVCMVTLAARVGATRGSILTYVEAVIALVLGVVFRNETVRPIELIGCAIILGAAWLAGRADT